LRVVDVNLAFSTICWGGYLFILRNEEWGLRAQLSSAIFVEQRFLRGMVHVNPLSWNLINFQMCIRHSLNRLLSFPGKVIAMIEVEVKARVTSFREIRQALGEKARFMGSTHQADTIFGHPNFLDQESKIVEGGIVSRIRESGDRKVLEFKEVRRDGKALELKHEITDPIKIREFLDKLGFKEAFTINKVRETFLYRDFMVCLDTVEQLGQFIEVEANIDPGKDPGEVWKQCFEVLKEFAPGAEVEHRKYGDLMQDIINQKAK
jgi:adenylate cyclase class 2